MVRDNLERTGRSAPYNIWNKDFRRRRSLGREAIEAEVAARPKATAARTLRAPFQGPSGVEAERPPASHRSGSDLTFGYK